MGAAPGVRHPAILDAAGLPLGDALGVADDEGADVVALRPGDHGPGRLVVGLADSATVAGLGSTLGGSKLSPTPRPPLTAPRGFPGHLSLPNLGVGEVQALLGPDRPSRDEQGMGRSGDGEGVDDPGVDPGHLGTGARCHRHLGRDVEDQAPGVAEQGDRADLIGGVGEGSGQAQPQPGDHTGHRQSHPAVLELEGPLVVAQRHQVSAASRVAAPLATAFPFGRLHAGVGVAAQDRAQRRSRELADAHPGGFPAELLVGEEGLCPPPKANRIQLDQGGPDVAPGPEQSEAAPALGRGEAQGDPSGAVDDGRAIGWALARHVRTLLCGCDNRIRANVG